MSKSSRRVVPVTVDPVIPGDGETERGDRSSNPRSATHDPGSRNLLSAVRRSAEGDKLSVSSEDSAERFTTTFESASQHGSVALHQSDPFQYSSLSDSVEGALDVVAESYILEGMREQLFEWCANGEETNPPGSGHEASTERADTETKEEENVSENAEGSSVRMNISGQSDLDGLSDRGSEGGGSVRGGASGGGGSTTPLPGEALTANSSSGNLSELDHSFDHAHSKRDRGNGHSTDSSRFSASTETTPNSKSVTSLSSKSTDQGSTGKKKKGYWYNATQSRDAYLQAVKPYYTSMKPYYNAVKYYSGAVRTVLSPTYKSRSEDFKKLFKEVPNDERLIVDYSCAMQKDILVHGRLYVTQNWICFYANIFRWETVLTVKCSEIRSMTKERTARVIPNAIQICTLTDKYFFTSFGARDKTFLMLFRVWQNALMDQPMSTQELWQWVHHSYGDELGLTSSDDDYVAPNPDEEVQFAEKLTAEAGETEDGGDDNESTLLNGDALYAGQTTLRPRSGSYNALAPTGEPNVNNSADDCVSSLTSASLPSPGDVSSSSPPPPAPPPPSIVTPDLLSPDVATDQGDTTEDEGLVTCSGHEHKVDLVYLDEVFHLNVDQLFQLLFTDSEFYRHFLQLRKTFDLVQAPWPEETDENGEKKREIGYTLSLNYSIGPKSTQSTEKQTLQAQSKVGKLYVVDADCSQAGIPYGENFYVHNRYCLMRVSPSRARLIVHSEIKYKKNVWGLVKSDLLRAEAEKTSPPVPGRTKKLRKRRPHGAAGPDRSPSLKRAPSGVERQPSGTGAVGTGKGVYSDDDWHIRLNADSLVHIVCAILVLLVFFNVVLFYKLWALEDRSASMFPHHHRYTTAHKAESLRPHSPEEWSKVIEQQNKLHEMELGQWRDVLTASVSLVDQMKASLEELLSNVDRRTQMLQETMRKQKQKQQEKEQQQPQEQEQH